MHKTPAQRTVQARRRFAGTWRGNSVCLVKNSPCRDEVNVYRFSRIAGRANSFSVTASKVVDDREVMMGSSECAYNGVNHAVECKSPDIRLVITGNKMEGNLTLSDGTPYRRISLQKKD